MTSLISNLLIGAFLLLPLPNFDTAHAADRDVVANLPDDTAINRRFVDAINALLDPSIPDSVVAEFDYYGDDAKNGYISLMRSLHRVSVDPLKAVAAWLRTENGPAGADEVILSHAKDLGQGSFMAMFRGQVFSWQYNNRRRNQDPKVDWATLINPQPWLNWDASSNKYVVRFNAPGGLLSTFDYNEKIVLTAER